MPCTFSTHVFIPLLHPKKKKTHRASYFLCRCLYTHFPIFNMPQPYVSGWACVQCSDGAYRFRITFRTVSATDMIWYNRYSQQPSAGRTVDTVLPSPVIPSFRGSPRGSRKIHTHTQLSENKFELFSLNPDLSEYVYFSFLAICK